MVGVPAEDTTIAGAAVFKPEQKRRADNICKKGTDGSGFIEGTVFSLNSAADGYLDLQLTVELGLRIQVLLSGCIPANHRLPLNVGTKLCLALRGSILEDLPKSNHPKPLLPKRLVWRDGVILHAKHHKTGDTAFYSTWDDDSDSKIVFPTPMISNASHSTSTVPRERPRTPPQTVEHQSRTPPKPHAHDSNSNSERNTPDQPSTVSHSLTVVMDVEPRPSAAATSIGAVDVSSVEDPSRRLPSLITACTSSRDAGKRHERPLPRELDNSKRQPAPKSPRHGAKAEAKHLHNQKRRHKNMASRWAGKTGAPSAATPSENEDERYLWENTEDIPDEVFCESHLLENGHAGEHAVKPDNIPPIRDQAEKEPPQCEAETPSNNVSQTGASNEYVMVRIIFIVIIFIEISHAKVPAHVYTSYSSGARSGRQHYGYCRGLGSDQKYEQRRWVVDPATSSTTTDIREEFMLRIRLFDQTNVSTRNGLGVSLFDKKQLPPKIEAGDVVVLCSLTVNSRYTQVDGYGTAVGASYKGWSWAVYRHATGRMTSAEGQSRHLGLAKSEMRQCLELADWWRGQNVVQLGPETSSSRSERSHLLISDVLQDIFFDCTVEVVHTARMDERNFAVYVTDYTRNEHTNHTHGDWCPAKLAPFVLQVEFSMSSYDVAAEMEVGRYYAIHNMKSKYGNRGYMEGRMQEGRKIKKLDEDELEFHPELVELLKRKHQWVASSGDPGLVAEFPHQLINEAEENHHFNCTVEVVHLSLSNSSVIYVTDYTSRSDLVPIAAHIASESLAGRVVRINLFDAQAEVAQGLAAGDFISIRNLRLKTTGSPFLSGKLGGPQRLIRKLNPKAKGNAELQALLKRREEMLATRTEKATKGKQRRERETDASRASADAFVDEPPRKQARKDHRASLAAVKADNACPAVFRVRARVVDFYPDDLHEWAVYRCTSCQITLPKSYRRCAKCDDVMDDDTAVEGFFQIWFRIEDEEGTTLDVSVSDERGSVLKDITPEDMLEDEDAFEQVVSRISPLVGELLLVEDGEACHNVAAKANPGPWLDLTLGSWYLEADTTDLRAYLVLKHSEV
ncbi:uncharacterized protein BXZ73DRAFT_37305 [Epithele typhae]|uniref:uncharacterized protein n=1 Tax=Epithele typhae TaxID=378194 RepID=UPI002008A0CC|nr:uncharacterized protein BXZ73DRAFT_37305 [Epithele typhae]KAH9945797.1 hypothetical protein BXZ73DRAFT_37305 [Epithele typhae]